MYIYTRVDLLLVFFPFSYHWQSWLNSAINFGPFNAHNNSYDTLVIMSSFSCSFWTILVGFSVCTTLNTVEHFSKM